MSALITVILPVFLLVGFGYLAVWRKIFPDSGVDSLMLFAQNFAIPALLFTAISTLDLNAELNPRLLGAFYSGAIAGFVLGLLGARLIAGRPWEDSVAVGFSTLFSNLVLLGLPIMTRAYGIDALGSNYAIIAFHAPFCYTVGVVAMELVRAQGRGLGATLGSVGRSMSRNPLVIAIALGFAFNLSGVPVPGTLADAIETIGRAGLPVALFGLGGILVRYKPEGDLRLVAWICAVSLLIHPGIVWSLAQLFDLTDAQLRSAVMCAAMAPGVNTYVFANMYGVAKRTAATGVLAATGFSILTVWFWLAVLP